MDKQAMREEAERLIRETMERKAIVVKQGNTRIAFVDPDRKNHFFRPATAAGRGTLQATHYTMSERQR